MNQMEVDEALDRIHAMLVDGELERAEAHIEMLRTYVPEPPEAAYLQGLARLEQGTPCEAVALLEHAIRLDPDYADAHHLLAEAHALLEDHAACVRHNLRTWELDLRTDAEVPAEELAFEIAQLEGEAERLLAELPAPFRARLENVPVILQARPSRDLVATGFDPRAMGLFEGPNDALTRATDAPAVPSRIVVFYANLLDETTDEALLVEELRITLLHEIGHYFGLDEEAVAALGLA